MEKMNQVSVTEFMSKSKEEMYDMAVEMVEKYNRLVDICNDSAERIADLIKETESRKKAFNDLKEEMANRYITIETHNGICKTYEDSVDDLKEEIEGHRKAFNNLKKELEKTYKDKETDLKNHNKRDMTLVDELAGKNDKIKNLVQEVEYYKNQERIRTDQLRATESKVEELWKRIEGLKRANRIAVNSVYGIASASIREENDHGKSGFKEYIEWLIEEEEAKVAERFKERLNKEITEIFEKEETEVNKKFGYTRKIAVRLRSEVDKKRIVDISDGAERILGVSRELFDDAVKALVDDEYQEIIGRIPQATNSYVYMDIHVLTTPDVETKDAANPENIKSLDSGIPCGKDSIE